MSSMPRYSLTSVNVGDDTWSSTPRPRATPCTKVVLPAPSSPVSATASPARKRRRSASPTSRVSSAVGVRSSMRIRTAPAAPRPDGSGTTMRSVSPGADAVARGRWRSACGFAGGIAGSGGASRVSAVERRSDQREVVLAAAGTVATSRRRRAGSPPGGTWGSPCGRASRAPDPATGVMPVAVLSTNLVAKLPRVTTTRGWISEICSTSHGVQASISSGCGSRLPGGRHFTTFAM